MSGQGRMSYLDGSSFKGKWKDGHWNGRGVAVSARGVKTAGLWRHAKWTSAVITATDNATNIVTIRTLYNNYIGEVNGEGQKHGKGRLECTCGSSATASARCSR
jgi:hypothetical protein